jgi:HEAT repeat protein
METKRKRVLFGPLFYVTLGAACAILLGLGLWSLWPTWRESWDMRRYATELRGPSPLFARRAAEKLARAGTVAVPWLTDAARDPDARVRALVYATLGETRPASKDGVDVLIAGLRDGDALARYEAADALGRLGFEAVRAADALTTALGDSDPAFRLRSARALWRAGGPMSRRSAPTLLELVAQTSVAKPAVRLDAIDVIRQMGGETDARALESLVSLTTSVDPAVRREVIECLERYGRRARIAIPSLERALDDEDLLVRCLAASALSEIEGWEKGRALSLLKSIVDNPALPPGMGKRLRWVIDANLVHGSEFSQPVHVLRALVAELKETEDEDRVSGHSSDHNITSRTVSPQ